MRNPKVLGLGLGFFLNTALCLAESVEPELSRIDQERIEALRPRYKRPESVPFPKDNPYTQAKYNLGKKLFFDPRLSGNGKISCASCHAAELEWSDARDRSIGNEGVVLPRRSPSLWDIAWMKRFFWDGRSTRLEGQSLLPLFDPHEMNAGKPETLVQKLLVDMGSEYQILFKEAFPESQLLPNPRNKKESSETIRQIAKAIATFERTLVSPRSKFDDFIDGDYQALSIQAQRGLLLFNSPRSRCMACHSTWRFTDDDFHDIGLKASHGKDGEDLGKGGFYRNPLWHHQFKTPSLRRLQAKTHFMHDGSMENLEEVLAFYNRGGDVSRKTRAPQISALNLSAEEVAQLKAFLEAL